MTRAELEHTLTNEAANVWDRIAAGCEHARLANAQIAQLETDNRHLHERLHRLANPTGNPTRHITWPAPLHQVDPTEER